MAASESPHRRAPRHRWPLSEKRRIVELTLPEGASIRTIAREHGLDPTSLSHWRALYRAGQLEAQPAPRVRASAESARFVPVSIAPAVRTLEAISNLARAGGSSVVQLVFASGAALRIEAGDLDAALVRALVAELRR